MGQLLFRKSSTSYGTYAVLILALGSIMFFGVCNPQGFQQRLGGTVASLDSETISYREFVSAYQEKTRSLQAQHKENFDPVRLKIASQTIEELLTDRSFYLKAVDLGLKATDSEVVEFLNKQKEFFDKDGFSEKKFRIFLKNQGFTESTFQEYLKRILSVQALKNQVASSFFLSDLAIQWQYFLEESKVNLTYIKVSYDDVKLSISDADVQNYVKKEGAESRIKAWYEQNQSRYKTPEKVHARHILISYKEARRSTVSRSEKEARMRAQKILLQVKAKPEDFIKIANKETDEQSGKKSGGDLGYFEHKSMAKEFSDAAFKLKIGEVSTVIKSPFGFHIIKLEARKKAQNISLDSARLKIAKQFIHNEQAPQKTRELAKKALLELKKETPDQKWLESQKLKLEETGEVSLGRNYFPGLGSQPEIRQAILSLNMKKRVFPRVLPLEKSFYVLKLASLKIAKIDTIKKEQKEMMRQIAFWQQRFGSEQRLNGEVKADIDKKYSVYRNSEYLTLDKTQQAAGDQ